jgi:hypothetical protein
MNNSISRVLLDFDGAFHFKGVDDSAKATCKEGPVLEIKSWGHVPRHNVIRQLLGYPIYASDLGKESNAAFYLPTPMGKKIYITDSTTVIKVIDFHIQIQQQILAVRYRLRKDAKGTWKQFQKTFKKSMQIISTMHHVGALNKYKNNLYGDIGDFMLMSAKSAILCLGRSEPNYAACAAAMDALFTEVRLNDIPDLGARLYSDMMARKLEVQQWLGVIEGVQLN